MGPGLVRVTGPPNGTWRPGSGLNLVRVEYIEPDVAREAVEGLLSRSHVTER